MASVARSLKIQPLWIRVERNRLKIVVFLIGFALMWALAFVVASIVPTIMVYMLIPPEVLEWVLDPAHDNFGFVGWLIKRPGIVVLLVAGLGATSAIVYAAITLKRPLRKQLAALGVRRLDIEKHPQTRRALREMAIAAGFADRTPELFVLDSNSINAFMLARGSERAFCVVTSGLIERFDVDEQRAVFANLMARLRAGDIQWATMVSALMTPLWLWQERDFGSSRTSGSLSEGYVAGDTKGLTYMSNRESISGSTNVWVQLLEAHVLLGVFAWIAYVVAVIASEIVTLGHRRSHLLSSEIADAEGMLLLKDPTVMLRTLRRAIEADNRVRLAQPIYAQMFYIWAGDDLVDEHDPEWKRLHRLREVLGVEGMYDTATDRKNVGDYELPVAPRLEMAGPSIAAGAQITVPSWAVTWLPLAVTFVVVFLTAGKLFAHATLERPLWASFGTEPWITYGSRLLELELRLIAITLVVVMIASVIAGRGEVSLGIALIGIVVSVGNVLVARALAADGIRLSGGSVRVVALVVGCGVASMVGGWLGSVIRRKVAG